MRWSLLMIPSVTSITAGALSSFGAAGDRFVIDDRRSGSAASTFGSAWRFFSDGVMGGVSTGAMTTETVSGRPAPGVKISLHEIGASARGLIKETATNADGRTDAPLIAGEPLRTGTYELSFHVGDYFAKAQNNLAHARLAADPPFLDVVPIRFAIAEPEGHYHVPLLVTPWSYTTYRGS